MASRTSKGALSIYQHGDAGFAKEFARLCRRRDEQDENASKVARKIIDEVREEGDAKLLAYTKKFDGASLLRQRGRGHRPGELLEVLPQPAPLRFDAGSQAEHLDVLDREELLLRLDEQAEDQDDLPRGQGRRR